MTKNEQWEKEGDRIRDMREAIGLSRKDFAARLGISPLTLKGAELGHQRLGGHTYREAERIYNKHVAGDCELGEAQQEYPSVRAHELPTDAIAHAIRIAQEEDVINTATSLARVAGIPYEQALAIIIQKRLEAAR